MRIQFVLGLVAVALIVAGCTYDRPYAYAPAGPTTHVDVTPTPNDNTVVTEPPAAAPQAQSLSDHDLVTSVRHEFHRYGALSGDLPNISIVAENGLVTLSGTVADERDKQMIDAMVRNTPGVVDMVDQLSLASAEPNVIPPTSRATESRRVYADAFDLHVQGLSHADRELGEQILQGLRTDTAPGAPAPKVDIYVSDSRVILRGVAYDEQQRESILAAVQRAAGANNVQDELQVQQPR